MYDDKSAKDLLAQYPQRYAEGGEAAPTSYRAPSIGVGAVDIPTWASPTVAPKAGGKALPGAASSFEPVKAPPRRLKQFNELSVSPTALSPSQQFARDRAAQDELLRNAYAQTGAIPLSNMEYQALKKKVQAGELNAENIREKLILPTYQSRVNKALEVIGRSPTEDKEAAESWFEKLSTGTIKPQEFETAFLTAASAPPTWSANAAKELESVNKARALLKMDPLTEKDLAGYKAPPPVYNYNISGIGGFGTNSGPMGFNNNNPLGINIAGLSNLLNKPAPATPPPAPVDFSKPTSTQLFRNGGEVEKEETEAVLSKKELLDMLIERQAMQDLLSEMSSVRIDPTLMAGTFEDKNAKGRYYDVGADISLGDKLGIGASGRGTSVKFDGGNFKENVLSQLRGSYTTDDGIRYAAEYSPVGNPGQLDPTQKAFRLSRRNLNDQSEISLSREPGRMGFEAPGQAPEPGTTDTTWLRYAKEFKKGGDVKKSEEFIMAPAVNVTPEDPSLTDIASTLWKGFGNNPRNVETFDAMANMNPLMAAYRGAKTLSNADYAALEDELTAPFYGTTSPEKNKAAASAAKDVLFGAMDLSPVAPFATAGVKAGGKALAKEVARQVETGTGMIGRNTMDPRTYMAEFYSPAAKAVEGHKMDKMPAGQWISWLNSNAPKAAKEELNQTGARKWLEEQKGIVTKQELADKIKQESPELLTKTMKPFNYTPDADNNAFARFGNFTLPDGQTNYREMTISLPVKEGTKPYIIPDKHAYKDPVADTNRVAHVRMNDRMDRKGNSVLFVEEIQSDWGQTGRDKGFLNEKSTYRDEKLGQKVPKGPYVEDTKAWTRVALKKIIEDAAEKGYSSVAFTTGAQQNARYNLAKVVDKINLAPLSSIGRKMDNELFLFTGYKDGQTVYAKQILKKELPDVLKETIGPEVADRLMAQKPEIGNQIQSLKGEQLKIGGKGMVGYYDEILPQALKEELKQLGVNTEIKQIDMRPKPNMWNYLTTSSPGPKEIGMQMGFDITPELINAVKEKGISKFKHGGEVSKFIKSKK